MLHSTIMTIPHLQNANVINSKYASHNNTFLHSMPLQNV